MDELSAPELRGAAFAANLRRAYGAPVEADIPPVFVTLLHRLSKVQPAPDPKSPGQLRLDA